jgi:hypothetical protein
MTAGTPFVDIQYVTNLTPGRDDNPSQRERFRLRDVKQALKEAAGVQVGLNRLTAVGP